MVSFSAYGDAVKQTSALMALLIGIAALLPLSAKRQESKSSTVATVMITAVSRDDSMLTGGISSSRWKAQGTVDVEPLARLTSAGEWIAIPCRADAQKSCDKFAREYLSKPHVYSVISGDGTGATVRAKPTTLDECYGYGTTGTYSGGRIERSALAAASTEMFASAHPVKRLTKEDRLAMRTLVATLVPKKLDSTKHLEFFEVELEGKSFTIVQRAFSDESEGTRESLVFGIGVVVPHSFKVLHWKQNTEDEVERILGTIALKSGREFLISVVDDPEGHWYRVYGIENGQLKLIFSGGGGSC